MSTAEYHFIRTVTGKYALSEDQQKLLDQQPYDAKHDSLPEDNSTLTLEQKILKKNQDLWALQKAIRKNDFRYSGGRAGADIARTTIASRTTQFGVHSSNLGSRRGRLVDTISWFFFSLLHYRSFMYSTIS